MQNQKKDFVLSLYNDVSINLLGALPTLFSISPCMFSYIRIFVSRKDFCLELVLGSFIQVVPDL